MKKHGVQCPQCKKRLFSFHVHDYKTCGCPNDTMIDGGDDYGRYGWMHERPIDIEWNDALDGGPYKPVERKDRWPY